MELLVASSRDLGNLFGRVRQHRLPCLKKFELLVGHIEGTSGLQAFVEIYPAVVRASVRVAAAMSRERGYKVDLAAGRDFG